MDINQARELVEKQAHAWENADAESALADFASDGVLISPGGRWQGHDAIRKAMHDFFEHVTTVEVKVTRVLLDGTFGAAEWTWCEVRQADGSQHITEDAIIFEVCNDKIVYWREYFDTATF